MASVPRQLNQRHLVAARLVAAGRGRREVAQAVGWHPSTVSHVARAPAFQEAVARFGRRLDAAVMAAHLDRLLGPPGPCRSCGAGEAPRRRSRSLAAEGQRRRVVQASVPGQTATPREEPTPTGPRLPPEAIAVLQRLNQPGASGPT